MFDNIVAIASGNKINQAISIIRATGPDVFNIVQKFFKGKVGENNTVSHGWIYDKKILIDEVLVLWFKGSKNFIGEDTVEINAHGGHVNTQLILELFLVHGCRMANPGEFSQRAFLNGKMDLVKAEAINDLIHAQTKAQAIKSASKLQNKTSDLIHDLIADIEFLIGHCETNIDYPEMDDIEELTITTFLPKINNLLQKLQTIIKQSENARNIFEGVKMAIVGQPNVGKSSLLNALLNEEKAIVTNISGTTRDVLEAAWQYNGILFKIQDTAGIRHSKDLVEQIGMEKTFTTIENSELIIHLIDPTIGENIYDQQISETSRNKKYFKVYNKKDLLSAADFRKNFVYISTKNNDLTAFEKLLDKTFISADLLDDNYVLSNQRQITLAKAAGVALEDAKKALENGFGPDVVIVDIRQAWESLYSIIGKPDNERLLDSMFSNFCLGK
ncbi:tRNA uridine-5-carboxymethylaminomethyl(34) synthesis GTPase MnmE [Mycoplasma iguanae]|uniref:tRNA modification GTPase MnmE n=1 Tax=Mycoplasma iguanae TaxID=292461 RepID=A0ABY5R814_9MOLU|nr:tRNA uridine-5-carboxymethylaminomethyl(34) synthesis GTPase MnmE [Mycoplasma iguanae]UVD81599.1 tRNA uridine-5-carboxymethylaminomethyl(34) synthesis GTPase MnmE [Mycoplasma iguanae]